MLSEMAALGFEHVELSHGIRVTLVPGILRAVEAGVVKISSTHNFCPLPVGVIRAAPNLFEPSAKSAQEYEQWVRHTRRSIDFAAEVKARVVVCHLGSVRFFWFNPAENVRRHLREHPGAGRGSDDGAYHALLQKSLAKLRRRMPPFWERVKAGIGEVIDFARQKGVSLGLENRDKFEELPLDADFAELLASLGPEAPVGYWHDTGHADIKEGMGVLQHHAHLEALASRTIGFHLHDVNAQGHDHQPIGAGRIDFEKISRLWRPEQILVLELSPRVAVEDVRASRERIEALMGG